MPVGGRGGEPLHGGRHAQAEGPPRARRPRPARPQDVQMLCPQSASRAEPQAALPAGGWRGARLPRMFLPAPLRPWALSPGRTRSLSGRGGFSIPGTPAPRVPRGTPSPDARSGPAGAQQQQPAPPLQCTLCPGAAKPRALGPGAGSAQAVLTVTAVPTAAPGPGPCVAGWQGPSRREDRVTCWGSRSPRGRTIKHTPCVPWGSHIHCTFRGTREEGAHVPSTELP